MNFLDLIQNDTKYYQNIRKCMVVMVFTGISYITNEGEITKKKRDWVIIFAPDKSSLPDLLSFLLNIIKNEQKVWELWIAQDFNVKRNLMKENFSLINTKSKDTKVAIFAGYKLLGPDQQYYHIFSKYF